MLRYFLSVIWPTFLFTNISFNDEPKSVFRNLIFEKFAIYRYIHTKRTQRKTKFFENPVNYCPKHVQPSNMLRNHSSIPQNNKRHRDAIAKFIFTLGCEWRSCDNGNNIGISQPVIEWVRKYPTMPILSLTQFTQIKLQMMRSNKNLLLGDN